MGTITNSEDIVCYGKKDIQTKKYSILKNYSLRPLEIYNGPSQV